MTPSPDAASPGAVDLSGFGPHPAPGTPYRTAGELAGLGLAGDDSTPLARSVEHALLVREGRRLSEPAAAPDAHPGDGGREPEGWGRQDHHHGEHGRRARPARAPGAGGRPRPAGQRLHGARPIDHHRGTPSTYDAVVDGQPLAEIVQPSPEIDGLFVVPATIDLAGAEIELVSLVAREGRLRRALHAHPWVFGDGEDRFDYVLIDCPPSLGLLTLNALVAGDEMLIPIQAEYYALEGLGQLLETVEMVKAHLNPDLAVSTIVLTMYDARTRLSAGVAEEVRTHFGGAGAPHGDPPLGADLRGAELRPDRDDLRSRAPRERSATWRRPARWRCGDRPRTSRHRRRRRSPA